MNPFAQQNMVAENIQQRREQLAGRSRPACQSGAANLNALASIDLGLAEHSLIHSHQDPQGAWPLSGLGELDR
jgi:hypothetical protein